MPIDITDIEQTPLASRYKTAYDKQFETLPEMSLSVPRSRYDEGFIYNQLDPYGQLQEERGQKQPGLAKIGLGVAKAGVLAATTAADGIIGTAIGLMNMAEEQKASAFWDNPFSKLMNDINNKAEEWMPIYQTKASKNASFIGQMGYADFWGDKFLKNLGFTAGMIIDGMITGGASMELMGAKALASKLPKAIATAAMEGDKALGVALQAGDAVKLSTEIINNANKLSKINRTSQALGSVLAAQGESRFEALNNSTDFYNKNKDILDADYASGKYSELEYNDKLRKLNDAKEGYGNADFLANAVILGISNGIQFKNLFTKGFNPTEKIAKGIVGDITSGYRFDKPVVSQAAKIAKNVLAEGVWEEQGQFAAQKYADDFYQRKFDGDSEGTIDDMFKSVYSGLAAAYGTREGWDQGLIGSLTGAIGLPGITRDAKSGHVKLDWQGGIWGDIKEVKEQNEFNKDAVDHLNSVINTPEFKNNYEGLIRTMSLEKDKLKAAAEGDKYEVLNAQHAQFINDALTFIRAGKYEDFEDNIKNIRNSNAEEVRQLFKSTDYRVGDVVDLATERPKPGSMPGQKDFIDIFGDYTSDEITKKINKNADEMLKDANNIRRMYSAFSTLYPGISEEAKEHLIYYSSMLDNLNKRISDINNEGMSKFGIDVNDHVKADITGDSYNVKLGSYIKELGRVASEGIEQGKINPADLVEFKEGARDLPKLIANKLAYTDMYKKITSGEGLAELENQVTEAKKKQEEIKKEEEPISPVVSTTPEKPKKGQKEPQDLIETTNEDENPDYLKSPLGKREKGLREVATSLSHSHYDPTSKKTVVRNDEFDSHISNPSNDLVGDKVDFSVDTSTDDDYKSRLWDINKKLKERLDSNKPLTEDEANKLLSDIKKTQGQDNFDSLVDILPIKATYTSKDGRVFDKGLYYHDSRYDNIFIPRKVREAGVAEINKYVSAQKEKTRENRKRILMALLTGKDISLSNIKKTKGIPNNTGVNKRIDEVLKTNPNQIKLGVALSTNTIWTGNNSESFEGHGAPGNIFFETNKTANGEVATIKANVQKLSKEHAEILWNSILTRFHPHQHGYNATYNGDEVEGLTVGEVIELLTNMGQHTNLDSEKYGSNLGEHLRNKQLYVDSRGLLHYGTNTVKLIGGVYRKNSGVNVAEEKSKFIKWATTNKNYAVNTDLPKLGIELNKVMKKKFKIGSWVSDGKDTYAGSLIKHGFIQTDVDEYKGTGSLFKSPVTIVDLTASGLTVTPSKKTIKENKVTQKAVSTAAKAKTTKPENTGTVEEKIEVGNRVVLENFTNNQLRSLPAGTDVWVDNIRYEEVDGEKKQIVIPKIYVSIVDNKGKKYIKVVNPKAAIKFGLSPTALSEGEVLLPMDDINVKNLAEMVESFKKNIYADTSKSTQAAIKKEEVKSVVEEKPTVETKPTEEVKEEPIDIDLDNLTDIDDIEIGDEKPHRLVPEKPKAYKVFDQKKELKWLNDKLGDIPVEIRDGLIYIAKSGKRAFGQLRSDSIVLSNVAEVGTTYHEAFHRVNLLLRTDEERSKTYNEARKRYNLDKYSDRQVEEFLAEKFREYVMNREANKPTGVLGSILNWFKELYQYVKRIFTGNSRLTELDIDHLFESIQSGMFKHHTPLAENLKSLGGETYELEIRERQLDNILTYNQYKSLIRGLASMSMKKVSEKLFSPNNSRYGVIDIVESLNDLDLNATKDKIANTISQFKKASATHAAIVTGLEKDTIKPETLASLHTKYGTKSKQELAQLHQSKFDVVNRRIDLWQEVYDNYDSLFKEALKNYISNELNIRSNEDDDEDIGTKELVRYDKASYEYSAKENILHSIKFLLSNLHASEERNEFTGMYDFVTMDEIWSRLMADLHTEDSIEDMISILESKDYYPYKQLAKKLKEGSELLRTQFETSFRKHRHAFINAMFLKTVEGNKTNYQFYFTDADIHKASNQAMRTWNEMFSLSNLVEEGKINVSKLNSVFSEYNALKQDYRDAVKTKTIEDPTLYKNKLVDILGKLKIEIDGKTVDKLLTDIIKSNRAGNDTKALSVLLDEDLSYLFSKDSTLYKFATDVKDISKLNLTTKNLFKNESIIKNIATAFVEVNPQDTSDTLPGPEGNNHYIYSDHSYVTQIVKELATDDSVLNKLLSDVFSRHSYVLKQLVDDSANRSRFSVATFNAFIRDQSSDDGRGYLDISPIEDFLFKLYAFNSAYMAMPTLADRKSYFLLKNVDLPRVRYTITRDADGNEHTVINDDIIDIFYEYALAERDRIEQAHKLLKQAFQTNEDGEFVDSKGNVVSEENTKKVLVNPDILVANYHYVKDGDTYNTAKGLAFKYQMFTSFNKPDFEFTEESVKNEIRNILNYHIAQTIQMADRLGVISKSGSKIAENNLLDNGLVKSKMEEYNNFDLSVRDIMANYTVGSMISSIESMMLFSGDIAFYKPSDGNPTDDYVKRLSVLTSSGALLRLNVPGEFESNDYTVSTLTNSKFGSTYYDLLYKKHFELLKKKYTDKDDEFIEKIVKKNLKAYNKLDPTDAQVYISPEMHREISIRRGEWSDAKQEAYDLLQSTEPLTEEQEYKLLNVVMQPLKYVYFDRVPQSINSTDNLLISTYDKMSLATLFRRFVAGTHMEDLLDRMEANGKYEGMNKIHMVKYDTAVKAGNRTTMTLFDNINTDDQSVEDLSKMSTYTQNFRYLRHQVITDPHEHQETLFGTQAKKVGMANIIDDADYVVDGKTIKGEEVKRNINNALSSISDKGLEELFNRLGVDENGNIDETEFQNLLYKEAQSAGLSENLLESIRIGLTMDVMSDRKWVYSRIISMVNSSVIDTHLPGNQLIQLSGFGLGNKDSVAKYDKTNDLKFLFDDEGNIKGVEAKVSVQVFNSVFPKDVNTYDKKKEWLANNSEVLQGLGYRIPTQGQNSMVSITVREFLPEQIGDVIILPNEFTALTGSDFDIDKLFFVRYNYEIVDGKVQKVKLDESKSLNENSKEAVQNYLLDHYRAVLLSENNFLSSSAPLGSTTDKLKRLSNEVMEAESVTRKPLDFTTPTFQAAVKYKYSGGKFGVGPEALNNVHHIMCQVAKLSFNNDIGLGLKDEKGNTILYSTYGLPEDNGEEVLISDWLSALIDSHVDIAKDPYIINLNVVRRTYNVTNLLVRVGMGQKTFEFLPQPILKDLVSETINTGSEISLELTDKPEVIVRNRYQSMYKSALSREKAKAEDIEKDLEFYDPFKDDLLKLIKTPESERDAKWYLKQLKIFDLFMKLDKGPAKSLNTLVMASRVDTKKYGKNLTEIKAYQNSVEALMEDNPFINIEKLMTLDPSVESSFISTYYRNSVDVINQLFSNKTVTATNKFWGLLDNILVNIKRKGTNDTGIINYVSDELYSAFAGRFFSDPSHLNLNSDKVAKILNNVSNFMRTYTEKYPELKDNFLLQSLVKGSSTEGNIMFLGIPSIKSDDNFTREDLTFGWIELLNSTNPDIVNFAKQLMVYAYYTSGFKRGAYSIFQYIPAKLLKELPISNTNPNTGEKEDSIVSFNEYIKSTISQLASSEVSAITEDITEDFFKNNWWKTNIVPDVADKFTNMLPTTSKEPALVTITNRKYKLGYTTSKQPVYQPYITVNVKDKVYLMEYVGYDKDENGIYKLTSKRGYANKGRIIKEYGLEKSIIPENNTTEITRAMIDKVIATNSNYSSMIYLEPEERVIDLKGITNTDNPTVSDATVVDNSQSGITTLPDDRSLNVGAESGQESYPFESDEIIEEIKKIPTGDPEASERMLKRIKDNKKPC